MPNLNTSIRPDYWAREMQRHTDPLLGYVIVTLPTHLRWYRRDCEIEWYDLQHRDGRTAYLLYWRASERGDLHTARYLYEDYDSRRALYGDDNGFVQGWASMSRALYQRDKNAEQASLDAHHALDRFPF